MDSLNPPNKDDPLLPGVERASFYPLKRDAANPFEKDDSVVDAPEEDDQSASPQTGDGEEVDDLDPFPIALANRIFPYRSGHGSRKGCHPLRWFYGFFKRLRR